MFSLVYDMLPPPPCFHSLLCFYCEALKPRRADNQVMVKIIGNVMTTWFHLEALEQTEGPDLVWRATSPERRALFDF